MENFCQRGKLERKDGYDVCRGEKWQTSPAGELRYDLTLLYPSKQTAGHYHTSGFPELFEVLSGNALFLTQNSDAQKTYLISAKEKEKVIILPEFSIKTINPSKDKKLMISNWISDKTTNDYNAFKNLQEPIKLKPKKLPKELENLDFLNNPEKYKNILTMENLYEQI